MGLDDLLRRRLVDRADCGSAVILVEGGEAAQRAAILAEAASRADRWGAQALSARVLGNALPLGEFPALLGRIATRIGVAAPTGGSDARTPWRFHEAVARFLAAAARRGPWLLLVELHAPIPRDVARLLRYLAYSLAAEPLAIVVAASRRPAALEELPGVSLGTPAEPDAPPRIGTLGRSSQPRDLDAALDEFAAIGAFTAAVDLGEACLRRASAARSSALRLRLAEFALAGGEPERAGRWAIPVTRARLAERAPAWVLLGRVRAQMGRAPEAEAAWRRALELDGAARDDAVRRLGELLVDQRRPGDAEKLLVAAIPEAAPGARPALRCELARARAANAASSSSVEPALRGVLKEARARADRRTEVRALGVLADAHGRAGDWRRQAALLREARTIAWEMGDVEAAAALDVRLAEAQGRLGDLSGRLETLTSAARTMSALGATALRVTTMGNAVQGAAHGPAESSAPPSTLEDRLFAVLDLVKVFAAADASRVVDRVLDTAIALTGARRGAIYVEHKGSLRVEVARGVDGAEDEGVRAQVERAWSSGEPAVEPHGDDAIVCMPANATGAAIGVLILEGPMAGLGPADMRMLGALADHVALALRLAKLRAQEDDRASALDRAAREIARLGRERAAVPDGRGAKGRAARPDEVDVRQARFGMVGGGAAMQRVFSAIERVAPLEIPVLVEGESGTGKEMVARALHALGPRRAGPLVSLNCAAFAEGLLESELFGHARGSFTGAEREREGLFIAAAGGTLFLDEIGDMSPRMQADLLRVLQERRVRPVGANQEVAVDARIVAATRTPLEDLVKQGRFREDLFYRLHVVAIALPPLRERREDIPPLVDHLLQTAAARAGTARRTVTAEALRRLCAHDWPGNVRQLEHTLIRALVLSDSEAIDEHDLALGVDAGQPADAAPMPAPMSTAQRRALDRRRIIEALEASGWNRSRACKRLGMPRRTFYRRLRAYGVL